jgi:hypothetical protein
MDWLHDLDEFDSRGKMSPSSFEEHNTSTITKRADSLDPHAPAAFANDDIHQESHTATSSTTFLSPK